MANTDEAARLAEIERVAKAKETQRLLDQKLDEGAARAMAVDQPLAKGYVRVRITKVGDKKIHTGEAPRRADREGRAEVYDGENVFPTFPKGEIVALPMKVAQDLEARNYVEIED